MFLGRATLYGLSALIYLERRELGTPATVQEISEATGMPMEYLRKLLSRLIRKGLIASVRGRKGGFRAQRSLDSITLLDLVEAMEGPMGPDSVFESKLLAYQDQDVVDWLQQWREQTANQLTEMLRNTSLDSLTPVAEDHRAA